MHPYLSFLHFSKLLQLSVPLLMSSKRLQRNNFSSSKTSWRRLQDILKTSWNTKNCYAEDVLKTSLRHVLRMPWRHVLKTSWRHVLKTSWRQTKSLLGKSVSKKSKSVFDTSMSHISISDKSRRIQNAFN